MFYLKIKFKAKVKVGKNQKTVLSNEELNAIVNTFVKHEVVEDFSISVTYDQIKEKGVVHISLKILHALNEHHFMAAIR